MTDKLLNELEYFVNFNDDILIDMCSVTSIVNGVDISHILFIDKYSTRARKLMILMNADLILRSICLVL